MLVRDLIPLLDAELIYGSDDIDIREIHSGCGSDMMSDVLAFVKDQPVLLTGLCNPQVIRTAEMMDIMCLVFVRGKRPDEKMIVASACLPHRIRCLRRVAYSTRPDWSEVLKVNDTIKLEYTVSGEDFTRAGEASSDLKNMLKQLGVSPDVVRKVSIAMYEGEINMVIHANGGIITVYISPTEVTMILKDSGPGIPDIDKAMQAGYSTAPDNIRSLGFGAGMGLPNMKKYSDDMKIETELGVGTTVTMTVRIC